jgi:hypothetical protein
VGIGSGFVDIDTDSIQLLIDDPNGNGLVSANSKFYIERLEPTFFTFE